MNPTEARQLIRAGQWTGPTAGLVEGYVQTNLVVLPRDWAFDFLLFCHRNPKPCPVLEVTETGSAVPVRLAPDADLRRDLPRYRLYHQGELVAEVTDVSSDWRSDLVSFLLGCSFTFERALLSAGVPVRHLELSRNVPMYITNMPCVPAGRFAGPLVVSMRPIPDSLVVRAVQVTARYPRVHGAPIHIGDPRRIGIADLSHPDFGDPVPIRENETPVFWACGVTTQVALSRAKPAFAITHAPGHMFITDVRDEQVADS
jgi:uncharacterized protein YcsI (UPF0317 family)